MNTIAGAFARAFKNPEPYMFGTEEFFPVGDWDEPLPIGKIMPDIKRLISLWQLPLDRALYETGEGLALLANLANLSAKEIDPSFYDIKSTLIAHAQRLSDHCWANDGIVYFETVVGQVSFHVFDEDMEVLNPMRHTEEWIGWSTQEIAPELCYEFLDI
ncbi:MAG: hypothetical protein NT141_03960 [candidate division WWE3 bacterium]|nr:hypothetical protein [candidate division WWE3 bacterium]